MSNDEKKFDFELFAIVIVLLAVLVYLLFLMFNPNVNSFKEFRELIPTLSEIGIGFLGALIGAGLAILWAIIFRRPKKKKGER